MVLLTFSEENEKIARTHGVPREESQRGEPAKRDVISVFFGTKRCLSREGALLGCKSSKRGDEPERHSARRGHAVHLLFERSAKMVKG
jgi:hypothetical protein